jgi:hypothetical protein
LFPAFDVFLAIGSRSLWVHGHRQGEARSDTTVPAALMGQPTIPDYDITSLHRYLDDAVSFHVDGDVQHGSGMLV